MIPHNMRHDSSLIGVRVCVCVCVCVWTVVARCTAVESCAMMTLSLLRY